MSLFLLKPSPLPRHADGNILGNPILRKLYALHYSRLTGLNQQPPQEMRSSVGFTVGHGNPNGMRTQDVLAGSRDNFIVSLKLLRSIQAAVAIKFDRLRLLAPRNPSTSSLKFPQDQDPMWEVLRCMTIFEISTDLSQPAKRNHPVMARRARREQPQPKC